MTTRLTPFAAGAAAIALTVCVAVQAPAAAATSPAMTAQPMMAPAAPPEHARRILVKVCNPTRNVSTTSMGPPVGYAPGFYPRSRYYWDDAYGFPYYQAPIAVNESGSLQIDYVNVTPLTAASIEFGLIANGRLVAEVRDVGTFSPNVEIKHSFGLNPNVFPLSTALPQCIPLRITYKDQSTWVNPHLPALQRRIYASP